MKVLGEALKKERELRDVTLDEIANEINIGVRFLEALENEDFSSIPGKFYIKHYIRSYLRAIGADEIAFFNKHKEYIDQVLEKPAEETSQYLEKVDYSKFSKRRLVIAMSIVAVLAVALTLLLVVLSTRKPAPPRNAESIVVPPPRSAFLLPASLTVPDSSALQVELSFSDRCWLQVSGGREKIIEATYEAGQQVKIGGYRLTVMLGNPRAVRLTVNGREITYFRQALVPETIVLDPAGLEALFRR